MLLLARYYLHSCSVYMSQHEQNCRLALQETEPPPNCFEVESADDLWHERCYKSQERINDSVMAMTHPACDKQNQPHQVVLLGLAVSQAWSSAVVSGCASDSLSLHIRQLVLCSSWQSPGLRNQSWGCAKQGLDIPMCRHLFRDGCMVSLITHVNQKEWAPAQAWSQSQTHLPDLQKSFFTFGPYNTQAKQARNKFIAFIQIS